MKIKIQFLSLLIIMSVWHLNAQQSNVIRGTVTDATGPLPGVSVIEKDKQNRIVNGVATDINGTFQIKVSENADSLHFSLIGMRTVVRSLKGQSIINVKMEEDIKEIGEVTIVGKVPPSTGGFFTPIDQLAAITTIKMEDLQSIPGVSIDQILEGQVPGLMINMNSGDPGSGSSIQIRGTSSLGLGTKPLIVMDDVPFRTEETVDVNNPEGMSELLNISPNDIESISVLKDAAATSLYGSDGANGVIVIRTKRGDNQKPRVNTSVRFMLKYPQRTLPLLNGDQYKTMILEAYQNRYGVGFDILTSSIRNLFLEKGESGYENYNNNTNWPDAINMRQGFGQEYSASIIGGGESAKYNISLGYTDESGPVIGTKFDRISGRFNFDYRISDKLTVNSDIAYVNTNKQSAWNDLGKMVNLKAPVLPIYSQDEFGNSLPTYFFPGPLGFQGDVLNPVALVNLAKVNNNNDRLDAVVRIRFSPIQGLQINSMVSGGYESPRNRTYLPHSATGDYYYRENNIDLIITGNVNRATMEQKNSFTLYTKNDVIYRLDLGKHNLVAGLYTIYKDVGTNQINLEGTNIPNEKVNNPYLTDIITKVSSERTTVRDLSVIGQLYYIYSNLYSIQASINRQGNSVFGANNRFGTFPSVSAFWRPLAEPFMIDRFSFWDEFKIRASYGLTGRAPDKNTIKTYNYLTYSANAPFIDMVGVTPDNIKLSNLRWEQTSSSNIGIDLGFFKGRLTAVGDISFSRTKDLILNAPVSNISGFESMLQNFGIIDGKAYEAGITGKPIQTKDWEFFISFNISNYKTKVIELPNNEPVVKDKALTNGKFMSLVNIGDDIGTIYGLKFLGVFPTDDDAMVRDANGNYVVNLNGERVPYRWMTSNGYSFMGGDARYADLNGDGIIDTRDVTVIGNNTPDFFGGFMLRLRYKRAWEVFANFTYQYGFDVVNETKMNTTSMYNNNNQTQAVLRRWRKQGDVTDIPRALYNDGHNWVGSDRYVEDGSYIKFSTLTLSYTLQAAALAKLNLKYANVALSVNNCGILTKYSGVDPSISANRNDPFAIGKDNSMTPQPIIYTFRVLINF